jgi:ligand-binding sensor domain-containing protein
MAGQTLVARARPATAAALAVLLACAWCARASGQSLDAGRYAHTAWRVRDGFTKGSVTALAQTHDGYLWLGTEFGLLCFDGVRAVPWQPPAGDRLPSDFIRALLVARDGTLWIGTLKGLASWKDGKLTAYPDVAGRLVTSLLQDRRGTIWVGALGPNALCEIIGGRARCSGAETFGSIVTALYEDRAGNLWVVAERALWRQAPGPPDRYALPAATQINALIEGDSGALLLVTTGGLKQVDGGRIRSSTIPTIPDRFRPSRFLRASDGSLWAGTDEGLLHLREGRSEHFGHADGLSGDDVDGILEDREGTVWVATTGGLDRFRKLAVPTVASPRNSLGASLFSVLATTDGSIWTGGADGLRR